MALVDDSYPLSALDKVAVVAFSSSMM